MKKIFTISLLLLTLLSCRKSSKISNSPLEFWETSTFEDEELIKDPINTLLSSVEEGKYGYVDHILLIKNGKIVLDQTFDNDYEQISQGRIGPLGCGFKTCEDSTAFKEFNYYHPYWHPYYKNGQVHTLQSVTKSISSILVGIAIDQGYIPSTNVKIIDFLNDYDLSKVEEPLKKATLEDLLTMRFGMEWHELDRSASDTTNTTFELERSDDWVQFTLNQPMDTLPGTKWVYNSGGSQLMSVIIKKATGLHLDKYAEKILFSPLGIKNYHWKHSPKGFPDALGGLYLEAKDLAKIGFLMLNEGDWKGRQIVSSDWVKGSTTRRSDTKVGSWGYGYQWWRPDDTGTEIWAGLGFGNQSLLVFPELETIAVVYCWNIFDKEVDDIRKAAIKAIIDSNMKKS